MSSNLKQNSTKTGAAAPPSRSSPRNLTQQSRSSNNNQLYRDSLGSTQNRRRSKSESITSEELEDSLYEDAEDVTLSSQKSKKNRKVQLKKTCPCARSSAGKGWILVCSEVEC